MTEPTSACLYAHLKNFFAHGADRALIHTLAKFFVNFFEIEKFDKKRAFFFQKKCVNVNRLHDFIMISLLVRLSPSIFEYLAVGIFAGISGGSERMLHWLNQL